MRLVKTLTIVTAAVAMFACSSKAKKPQTVATTKTATPPTKSAETTKSDTDLNKPADTSAAKDAAQLGPIIYFEFDSSTLDPAARKTLDENATWLKEDTARTLLIEGHTDETGTAEYNLGLGQRRAKAARDYLVRMGIDKGRIRIITYGEERPKSNVAAENRRSVFVATKKKK